MRSEYFFGFIISFIGGVAIESTFNFGYALSVLFAFLSIFILLTSWVRVYSKNVFLVSLVFLGAALGIARVDVSQWNNMSQSLDSFVGTGSQIKGTVINEPDVREEYTNIVLEVRSVHDVLYNETRILVRVPVYPEFHYGDVLMLSGKIIKPKNFTTQAGANTFEYRAYLAKDGIHYQMYFPKVQVIAHSKGNTVRQKLLTIKGLLINNISKNIPEPESSLANGITLGAKQSLGEELLQKFRETGVAHIVVLSGYNIAVVAAIISRVFIFLPFSIRLIVSALGIILFAIMVGGGATVVRATVMALVVILARLLGRESDALRVLVLAGGLMVFVNPMILLHDVSFQLSFSATLAIVTFVPVIEKYFLFISNHMLREIMVTTFATQFFVLPLILYHMGSVSLIGFIANIFILPAVPLAMILVALVAVLGVLPLIGSFIAFVAYALLSYMIVLVELFARVPFASLSGVSFPLWMLVIAYMLLGIYIVKKMPRKLLTQKQN